MRKVCLSSLLVFAGPALWADEGLAFFEKHIRPVLAKECYSCHSERAKPAQGNLYADSREGLLRGGKSGVPAVIPGKPEESLLIKAIRGEHKDLKMPPGKALDPETVQDFIKWVKTGAADPRTSSWKPVETAAYDWDKERKHWAYQPVRDPAVPAIGDPEWNRTEVDRFIKAKLDEQNLRPLPRATRTALIRRVTYDLTGLPPTPAEVSAFLSDASPRAFEKVVDRLLASRHYGEHWGRHWLDLVRYADTAGDASDFPVPELYRYRNYVIRSINSDKPMNTFLREQIAGDLMTPADDEDRRDKIAATSYLAVSRRFGQNTGEMFLTHDDTIENMSKAFLGLTAGCARCHDHKFDPIPQKDYYALAGIFQSTRYAHAGLEHQQYLADFVALDKKDQARLDSVMAKMVDLHKTVRKGAPPATADKDALVAFYKAKDELNNLRAAWPDIPMAYAVSEGKPVNAKVMIKGEPRVLGPEAPRGFFQILGGQRVPADHPGSGRDLLAGWIVDPKNPLTPRVLVNRVWLWHFGRGLVNSPNDFGTRGEKPSHPELLDYLAARFVEDGWSLKKMHRRIVLTRAYQTASGHDEAASVKDPKNIHYWRFDRRRLAAEEVRDTILAASGQLDTTPAGPHPFPPRASYLFTQHRPFVADLATYDHTKRSVYLLQQRFRRHPFLELFDGPDPNNTTPSRPDNTTALQSLYFMNNEFVHKQSDALAVRVGLAEPSTAGRVRLAYRLLFARDPRPAEQVEAARFLAGAAALTGPDIPEDQRQRAALASLMRALIASNEFFYID